MICPFRVDVEFEYTAIASKEDNEKMEYLEKAQRQIYAQCMEDQCPFYGWNESCERVRTE